MGLVEHLDVLEPKKTSSRLVDNLDVLSEPTRSSKPKSRMPSYAIGPGGGIPYNLSASEPKPKTSDPDWRRNLLMGAGAEPQLTTKRQTEIQKIISDKNLLKKPDKENPWASFYAKKRFENLSPEEKEYAARFVKGEKAFTELGTRESLLALILGMPEVGGFGGTIVGSIASKGTGPAGKVARRALMGVGAAKKVPGLVGKVARVGAATARGAEGVMEFETALAASEGRKPQLVPAAKMGATVGGGTALLLELLTKGRGGIPPGSGGGGGDGVRGNALERLPQVKEQQYSPESYQKWWEEQQKTPVEQRLDYEDWWKQNTPEMPQFTAAQQTKVWNSAVKHVNKLAKERGAMPGEKAGMDEIQAAIDIRQGHLDQFRTFLDLHGQIPATESAKKVLVTHAKVLDKEMGILKDRAKTIEDEFNAQTLADIQAQINAEAFQGLEDWNIPAAPRGRKGTHELLYQRKTKTGKYVWARSGTGQYTADISEIANSLGMEPEAFRAMANDILQGSDFKVRSVGGTIREGELHDVITGHELNIVKNALGIKKTVAPRGKPIRTKRTVAAEVAPAEPAPTVAEPSTTPTLDAAKAKLGGNFGSADIRRMGENPMEKAGVEAALGWEPEELAAMWKEAGVVEPVAPKQPAAPKPAAKGGFVDKIDQEVFFTPPSNETSLGAGVSPAAAIKAADNLDIPPPPQPGGWFKVARPDTVGRDYDLRDVLWMPRGIYDPAGTPIQKGVYDRVGEVILQDGTRRNVGTDVGVRLQAAERNIQAGALNSHRRVATIAQNVLDGSPKPRGLSRLSKSWRDRVFGDFVKLVEREIDDPARQAVKSSNTSLGQALRDHDALTEEFRQYIIESRNSVGIDTPSDWGITERGYYRHLFLGDIQIFVDGQFRTTAQTYADAQKMAIGILKAEPNAKIVARARTSWSGDPTIRVSTGRYFKTVDKISERTSIPMNEIMEDIRGTVGRKAMKMKFFGALEHRKGYSGYSKEYADVMSMHSSQVFRTQELSKLNHDIQPMVETLRANGKPGLADAIEGHLKDLWGTPTPFEYNFGRMISQTPILRNHVANPSMAFRQLAQKLTGLQFFAKLKLRPRAALVNMIQPFSTLWPYISTKDFVGLYADFLKPSTQKMLFENGVMGGSSKLETTRMTGMEKIHRARNPLNWFQVASEVNRGVGYLFGYNRAIERGMTPLQAHDLGLAWAEKVEFDNSTWNIPALLRSPQGRVLGQFKSFMLKNLENVREVWKPELPVSKSQRVGRTAKWTAAQIGIGGIKSFGMATTAAGGYAVAKYLKRQLQAHGMSEEDAKMTADAVYFGAPALMGQDLSASVTILEEPFGRTAMEKAANIALGPTVAMAVGAGSAAIRRKPMEIARAITPATGTYQGISQAIQKQQQTTRIRGGKEVPLTDFEAVMRGLGFTPLKQSLSYIKEPKAKGSTTGDTYGTAVGSKYGDTYGGEK